MAGTPKKAAEKKKKVKKPKKPATHPPFKTMITQAIAALKDRLGSSRQAILKFIMEKYFPKDADEAFVRRHLNSALARGHEQKWLHHAPGHSGSFKLAPKKERKSKSKKAEEEGEEMPKKKVTKKKAAAAPKKVQKS
jgi:hypothetical protein